MHWLEEKIKRSASTAKNHSLKYLILTLLFLATLSGGMQAAPVLSDGAEISVLTCGPGQALYAAFGHTAIRVSDSEHHIDQVYNYGTFDFATPNFYVKFLTGKLDYMLAVSSFDDFVSEYKAENRWVYEQKLLIPQSIKQRIYDSLQIELLPENRFYRYDFFRNNCSTKAIDLILVFTATGSMIDSLKTESGQTFRQALKPFVAGREWLNLGINLLLGPYADQPMSKLQSTYLPENLMHVIESVGIANTSKGIAEDGFQPSIPVEPNRPLIIFWVLTFALVIEALWLKTSRKTTDLIDACLFSTAGLLGILFVFFWIWSDHVSLHLNLNLFWANPLNFLLVWGILKSMKKLVRLYLIFYALALFFLLINFARLPQQFPMEIMPVVTGIVFRVVSRLFNFKGKKTSLS
jgi:hypothetical protein